MKLRAYTVYVYLDYFCVQYSFLSNDILRDLNASSYLKSSLLECSFLVLSVIHQWICYGTNSCNYI